MASSTVNSPDRGAASSSKLSPPSHRIEELKIPVPWGHIAVRAWGDHHTQPVLTIHGMQDNSASFDTLIPLLPTSQFYFVCVDLPGHGLSSEVPQGIPCRVSDFVTVLSRVVRYFNWEKIIFLGHSLGALMGFLFTCMNPVLVQKLIVIDCPSLSNLPLKFHPHVLKGRIKTQLAFEDKMLNQKRPAYTYEEIVRKFTNEKLSKLTRRSAEILLSRELIKAPGEEGKYHLTTDQRLKLLVFPLIEDKHYLKVLSGVKCPVLMILGSESGVRNEQITSSIKKVLKRNSSKFWFHIVEGNHYVHINNPERVAPLISDFLLGKMKSSL